MTHALPQWARFSNPQADDREPVREWLRAHGYDVSPGASIGIDRTKERGEPRRAVFIHRSGHLTFDDRTHHKLVGDRLQRA